MSCNSSSMCVLREELNGYAKYAAKKTINARAPCLPIARILRTTLMLERCFDWYSILQSSRLVRMYQWIWLISNYKLMKKLPVLVHLNKRKFNQLSLFGWCFLLICQIFVCRGMCTSKENSFEYSRTALWMGNGPGISAYSGLSVRLFTSDWMRCLNLHMYMIKLTTEGNQTDDFPLLEFICAWYSFCHAYIDSHTATVIKIRYTYSTIRIFPWQWHGLSFQFDRMRSAECSEEIRTNNWIHSRKKVSSVGMWVQSIKSHIPQWKDMTQRVRNKANCDEYLMSIDLISFCSTRSFNLLTPIVMHNYVSYACIVCHERNVFFLQKWNADKRKEMVELLESNAFISFARFVTVITEPMSSLRPNDTIWISIGAKRWKCWRMIVSNFVNHSNAKRTLQLPQRNWQSIGSDRWIEV